MKNEIQKFEQFLTEGKFSGGTHPDFEMDYLRNGIRLSDVLISTNLYSGNDLSVKIGMYSSSGRWHSLTPGKNIKELKDIFNRAQKSSKITQIQASEQVETELDDIIKSMQKEIFEAIVKELEELDMKILKIVADVVRKN